MPQLRGHFYYVLPKARRWVWLVFSRDRISLVGRGEAGAADEAARSATACINRRIASGGDEALESLTETVRRRG